MNTTYSDLFFVLVTESGCVLLPFILSFAQMEVLWSLLAIKLQEVILEPVVTALPGTASFQARQ